MAAETCVRLRHTVSVDDAAQQAQWT